MGSEQMLPLRLASKRSKTVRIVASARGACAPKGAFGAPLPRRRSS